MKHNFVATYNYVLPFERFFGRNRLTEGWTLSGTTRLSSGLPVTLFDDSDNSLLGTLGNGVNNQLLDTPQERSGPLQINTNPRNGKPEFNTSLFAPETLGQLGSAARRSFTDPASRISTCKSARGCASTNRRSLDIRVEAFNVFNHAQFYGRPQWMARSTIRISAGSSARPLRGCFKWPLNFISRPDSQRR